MTAKAMVGGGTDFVNKILSDVIRPSMNMLPEKMRGEKAEVMLLAIGLQESGFRERKQHGNGPAHGFWQFEKGGGVCGVMKHPSTKKFAIKVCNELNVPFDANSIHAALASNDILACCFARLLMFSDPKQLPEIGNESMSWDFYYRTWRPGKPHPERWGKNYSEACGVS